MRVNNVRFFQRSIIGPLVLIVALAIGAQPQIMNAQGSLSLTTGLTQGNGQSGISFEITANQSLKLHRFWCDINTGSQTVSVYANLAGLKTTTGAANTTGWYLVGSATVTGTTGTYVEIPVDLNIMMTTGDKYGFIIYGSSGVNYKTGTAPFVFSDSYMSIDTDAWGISTGFPNFGFAFKPRQYCGTVYYDPGFTGMNNAGLTKFTAPGNICAGNHAISVEMTNNGINPITSATINWKVNGVPQTPYSWTGTLDTLSPATRTTTVTIASGFTFLQNVNYNIEAWTTNPNGVPDTVNGDDTTSITGKAGLTGVYTVGGASPDYQTIADAVDELKAYGVCGPVTFNVRPGLYIGQITIPEIVGASSTNTITFNGSGASTTTMQYNTASSYEYVLCFDGADYVRVRNMTIKATGNSYGTGVLFTGKADYNQLTGCHVWVNPSSTSSNFAGIIASTKTSMGGSGDHANYNLIEGNTVTGGYYGIRFYGVSSTVPCMGNDVIDNVVEYFYYYGITMYYQGGSEVNDNIVTDRKGTASSYGIYIYYNVIASDVIGNQVEAGTYGIQIYYTNRDSTSRGTVANNMVTMWGTSTNYAIRLYYSHKYNVWNNSMNMLTNSTGYGIYVYTSSSYPNLYHDIRNNTTKYNGTGSFYPIYLYPSVTPLHYLAVSHNNNYRASGTYSYYAGGSTYTSVSALQSAYPGFFQNFTQHDPQYFSDYDLHSKSSAMDNLGTPILAVSDDFDGETRHATTPDIGADEYTPPTLDVALTDIILPASGCGLTTSESVSVMLKNNGVSTINAGVNPIPVQVFVTGAVTQTLSGTMSSGTIAPNATVQFTVSTSANLSVLGTYTFNATASMSGDQVPHNNSFGPVTMKTDANISTFPYEEDFESSDGGWKAVTIAGLVNSWEWGKPNHTGSISGSVLINSASSGQKVWMTGLESGYFDNEHSAVESPCFNLTSLTAPVLKFWMNINTEDSYDAVQVEASSDGGATWSKLTPYDPLYWSATHYGPLTAPNYSGTNVSGWNRYVFELASYAGKSNVKLRIVLGSDASAQATGVAIDDVELGDFNKYDYSVVHVQYDNAPNFWARIVGESHIVEATIKNTGYAANPATVPAVYKQGSNPTGPMDGVAETLPISWSGELGLIQFATPHVPTSTGIMPFFVRLFEPNDSYAGNDYNMTMPNVQTDKTLGYEDFELLTPPTWEKGFTILNPNAGPTWELQATSGVGGTVGATYPGGSSPANDWIISPAAEVLPGGSYSVGLKYRSRTGAPQTISIAYGTSPDPAQMTVLATYSGFTNTAFIDAINQDGVSPWFNVPVIVSPYYIGIHVSSGAGAGAVDVDHFRFFENPTPPPKIAYGNDPVWITDPSIPIELSAVYKKSGLLSRTYTVRNGTGLYGSPPGDMLWDVTTTTDWIDLVKSTPDPMSYLTSNPFNPPWVRQHQTFTLEIRTSTMQPGRYNGSIELDAYIYNQDFPNGLHASNVPFIVPVNLTIAATGGPGQSNVADRTHTGMTSAGNPWIFADNANNVFATVWVQAGTIPSMTIHSYPSQLPVHLSRFRYVNHYWTIDAAGTGWLADVQFHYFDTELLSHFVFDENALRGMRLAPNTSFWEDPIMGTTSTPDAGQNFVMVQGLNPMNHAGSIALAHDWLAQFGSKDGQAVPSVCVIDQNYPNPFNPSTGIRFGIPDDRYVTLTVLNGLGEEVARLIEGELKAGYHTETFNATGLPSGMYLYTLKAGDFTQTRSMILSK